MTLGVSISCMPAFSHMLRHALPGFETLRSRLTSRFSSSRSRTKNSSGYGSNYKKAGSEQSSNHGGSLDGYTETKDPYQVRTYEMGGVKPVTTYIGGGQRGQVSEDGVHLKYELRQESHSIGADSRNGNTGRSGRTPTIGRPVMGAEMV